LSQRQAQALLSAPDITTVAVCAIAPFSRSFSAADFGDRKWRLSRSRMFSSVMDAGASSICRKTRARSDRADANVGEGCDRRLDFGAVSPRIMFSGR
jgi:hypothetical protein